ncbi:hypothetical protein [Marinobacter sp. ATCH36]|uniref:hypothetical protein n=1 Tax=Marinobacter sp. ATCH36 TaxID=2945106 RepID=UPI0032E4B1E9
MNESHVLAEISLSTVSWTDDHYSRKQNGYGRTQRKTVSYRSRHLLWRRRRVFRWDFSASGASVAPHGHERYGLGKYRCLMVIKQI